MSAMPDSVAVTGIWLRSTITESGEHRVEVLAEVDEEWRLVIPGEPVEHPTISHIVEIGGMIAAPVDPLVLVK